MSKYDALTRHLKATAALQVPMAFREIEGVLGFELPKSARKHRPWWSNEAEGRHVQARAWANAGFQVSDVDMEAERLVFVRLNSVDDRDRKALPDHPLWGAMKGTVTIAPATDLTQPLWDVEATEQSLDELTHRLGGHAR